MTSDLFGIVQHGSKVYSTLVCRDQGSLSSSFSTDKLTILQEPPSSTRAYITITSPLYTAFLPRQGYFPSPPLTAVWGGLEDRAGDPLSYEVRILENGSPVVANRTDWSSARLLTVSELMLPYHPETHLVEVQARNSAGTYSEVRSTGFPSHQTHQLVQTLRSMTRGLIIPFRNWCGPSHSSVLFLCTTNFPNGEWLCPQVDGNQLHRNCL